MALCLSILRPLFIMTICLTVETATSRNPTTLDSANALFRDIMESDSGNKSTQNLHEKADSYRNLGEMYFRCGYYNNAFNASVNALRIAEEHGLDDLLPQLYNNLGTIYCTWNEFSTGIEYFKKGLKHASSNIDTDIYRSIIINIQGAYINLHDIGNARIYYDKMDSMTHQDRRISYFKTLNQGLFLLEEQNPMAIPFLRSAARIAEEDISDSSMTCSAFDYLGDAYAGHDNDSSIYFWTKAINNDEIPTYLKLNMLKKLSDIHKKMKHRNMAIFYGKQYMELSDSIFKRSEINRMKDAQLAYENEKTIRQINGLVADRKIHEQTVRSQRTVIFTVLSALFIVLIMLILVYSQKHKLNQAYIDLFMRNKEAIALQQASEQREISLKETIQELESKCREYANLKSDDSKTSSSLIHVQNTAETEGQEEQKTHKTQSVDKLSEEKKKEIQNSVETVFKNEDIICNTDFSMEKLAAITGFNSKYISHVINEAYGVNFRTLVNDRRMAIARIRIMDIEHYGNLTIQAISESVGYKSSSGFVQLFRKYTGVTPSMFQKMARRQIERT